MLLRSFRVGHEEGEDVTMRLLVVADEKKLAASLKRGLEADGFAVDVALDGTDGKWMATENESEGAGDAGQLAKNSRFSRGVMCGHMRTSEGR
jgi:hypothetical protein